MTRRNEAMRRLVRAVMPAVLMIAGCKEMPEYTPRKLSDAPPIPWSPGTATPAPATSTPAPASTTPVTPAAGPRPATGATPPSAAPETAANATPIAAGQAAAPTPSPAPTAMPASTPSAGGIAATSTGGMAPPAAVSSTAAAAPAAVPPPGAEQRFDAALQLLKSHQYAQATQAFETLTQEAPNLSGAWTNLGILEARAKKIEPAIDALTHATATNPANATAYLQLGIVEREAGRYAQAESAYLKALSIRSDYAKAHYNLAILYDRYLNRPQDALNQYRAYQQIVGGDDLKLQAWIKGLEARMAAATNPSPHGAPQ